MVKKIIVQRSVAQMPRGYKHLLENLKMRIRRARVKAALSVNSELVMLYWHIGKTILTRQQAGGWGAKVIDRLACDLKREFPEVKGFSPRNIKYMRAFAEEYPDDQFVQQVAAQIPWWHNVVLISKIKELDERLWYAQQTIVHGWSRTVLVMQIESELYQRQGKAVTNFEKTLPPPQSDLAQQTIKDPYIFDFLTMSDKAHERDIEMSLVEHVRKFLLELGEGFTFVGQQYPLEVGGEDFYIDLLFYHLKLRCYVVIELKSQAFKPEHAGKMNFYLSAVDDMLRHGDDQPSIGLILCKDKNKIVAEYAIRDIRKPIGVSQWKTRIVESLPKQLRGKLPSVKELEKELS